MHFPRALQIWLNSFWLGILGNVEWSRRDCVRWKRRDWGFSIESKSSAGVQPIETLKCVKNDVELKENLSGMFKRNLNVGGISSLSQVKTSTMWAIRPRSDFPRTL